MINEYDKNGDNQVINFFIIIIIFNNPIINNNNFRLILKSFMI